MARIAGRRRTVRVVVGALATVAATGLLGLGYAQANPQLPAPAIAAAAQPVVRAPSARPDQPEDRGAGREPAGRLRAAAPAPHHAAAPPAASEPVGSKPRPPGGPGGPPGGGSPLVEGTPCTATARACVSLDGYQAWLLDGGRVVRGPVDIQHGDDATPTPRGTFKVQWKAEQYTSREYLTQMPYSVFFAPGGIAFHEGSQDGPSGGCVKLVHEDAQAFFAYLQVGDEVQIH